jgi:ribosomal protein L16 Arg81 hydroxylase
MFFVRVARMLPELLPDFSHPDLGVRWVEPLAVFFAGGRSARVQMHFDVDYPDLFLCHFGGRKRVILFAPDQTPYLYRVPFSFSARFDVAPDAPDYDTFPALARARGTIAELGHGDALYIPPGYWHYVVYDDIGFSVSLRTRPRTPRHVVAALRNIVLTRTLDGLMRRTLGQRWNDRNEHLAVERVHRRLGAAASRPPRERSARRE